MGLDVVFPRRVMLGIGQLAFDDEVGDFEVVALLCQVLDRIATITQDACVASS